MAFLHSTSGAAMRPTGALESFQDNLQTPPLIEVNNYQERGINKFFLRRSIVGDSGIVRRRLGQRSVIVGLIMNRTTFETISPIQIIGSYSSIIN